MKEIGTQEAEILRMVSENDLKFIRLATCDLSGNPKNISILPGTLQSAFLRGMPFDCARIDGFEHGDSLLLFPESSGITVLPWRPTSGRVARILCDGCYPDGSPFEGDSRQILKKTIKAAKIAGFAFPVGTENEFYLFKTDENGDPTNIPLDYASYMDMAPADKGEDVRREICLSLEEMGILPERSYHEAGPGQNEIVFKGSDPLSAADNFLTYKMVVRTIASKNGLYASFDPKPLSGAAGSGLRIAFTLLSKGINSASAEEVAAFTAGINRRLPEISLFLNSTPESYQRLTALTRTHASVSGLEISVPSADLLLNPYLAFALLIAAGLEGIEQSAGDCEPRLPQSPEEAVALCQNSGFVAGIRPKETLTRYIEIFCSRVSAVR